MISVLNTRAMFGESPNRPDATTIDEVASPVMSMV